MNKIFGGIRMTWFRLILHAVISGIVTGLIALWVPEGNSSRLADLEGNEYYLFPCCCRKGRKWGAYCDL